ncbi:MAG: Fic family protein, partial [Gammaproteobacteria bacterium]|nr:Fic family protein [Gammaproteobacteria bacterium]
NNPRRPDGVIHEYCPPEQVEPEMRRFLDLYNDDIRHRNYPVNAEAAWLHHRFVRTHPFQDGNGRVSRQLMAWAYVKRSLPPPVVTAQGKFEYIIALEAADEGNLKAFSDYISNRSTGSLQAAVLLAKRALAGKLNRPNGNGGRTVGDQYLPPVPDDTSGGPFDP